MEFDDSLARICIRILYVWQLGVLIDSVVHLVVGFDWNIWKDIEWCMLMPQFELDALFHSELDYNPNKGMIFLEKQVLSCFLTFKATKTCCKMTLWWFMHYCRVGVRWDLHDTVLGDSRAEALWVGSATKMCFLSSVQFLCRTKMCTIEDFTLCRGALGGCEHHNRFIHFVTA